VLAYPKGMIVALGRRRRRISQKTSLALRPDKIDPAVRRYFAGEIRWNDVRRRGVDIVDAWVSMARIKRLGCPAIEGRKRRAIVMKAWVRDVRGY
jgi:hypothetical protein